MDMHPIEGSTNVAELGHDPDNRMLRVRFHDRVKKDGTVVPGGLYEVPEMGAADYESLRAAAADPDRSLGREIRALALKRVEE